LFFINLQGSYTTSFNVFRKLVNNGINLRLHNRVVILRSPDTIKKAVILTCFLPYFVTRSSIMSDKQLNDNDWDPLDPDSLKNQRQTYDELRERCPVAHSEFIGWSLFRHDDIAKVLADPETYSNASRFLAIPNGMDPPMHSAYRKALLSHFSADQMNLLEPKARNVAASLLNPLMSSGDTDFIESFATPYALKTLCLMLGWPDEQWKCLAGWAHGTQHVAFTKDPVAGKALAELFDKHVKINLEKYRSSEANVDNATTTLLKTEVNGKRLDDEQIVSVLRNWTAGHGTVVAGLSIILLHLAEDFDLQNLLRNEPARIPAVIEEILRVDGPLVANRRTTTQDVEIQDKKILKGESISLMWIAANRDPRVFDDAESIQVNRETKDGMVWGQGIHDCMGAPLARLEIRIALEELLFRTKQFCLSSTSPIRSIYPSNGLESLFLQFN